MPSHDSIYGHAGWYDVAFSYRDVSAECDFLQEMARRYLDRPPQSLLEVAAGPARHSIEMGRRGLEVAAIDRTPGMVGYGREQAVTAGVPLEYVHADMRRFGLDRRFDMAICMLASWSYLLTNDDLLKHLACMAEHLHEGAVYVVELTHPRDLMTKERSTHTSWEVEQNGKKVEISWGQPDDPFDPISQVTETTVELRVEDGTGARTFWEVSSQRMFTANEVDALVKASGAFRILDAYGGLDAAVPFDNERTAWRMVPVLQRI